MVFLVFPFVTLALMAVVLAVAGGASRVSSSFAVKWFSQKKRFDVFTGALLAAFVLVVEGILRRVFGLSYGAGRIVQSEPFGAILLTLYVVRFTIATPLVEEIFWRGYVQDVLQAAFKNPIGVVLQAILFALLHMRGPEETVTIFFIGLIFGVWRWRKRTLVPLIIAHMAINSVGCFAFVRDHLEWQRVKIVHNYAVLLEQLCTPADYSPSRDARSHYDRAFKLVRERPGTLARADLETEPARLSGEKLHALNDWVSRNQEAIAEFAAGAKAPYYVREYGHMAIADIVRPPHEYEARTLITLLLSRARMNSTNGDFQQCMSDVVACCQFARHLTGPKPLKEQLFAFETHQHVIRIAFEILSEIRADADRLKALQDAFERLRQNGSIRVDFSGQRLVCHDIIQMTFTDEGGGAGRVPRAAIQVLMDDPYYGRYGEQAWRTLDRKETVRLTNRLFAYLDSIEDITPAEVHRSGSWVQDVLHQTAEDNVLLLTQINRFERYYCQAFRSRARTDAIILTAAILRYRLEQGNLPDSLDHLVREGYVDLLPSDPFGGSHFVYRKVGPDFLLYSLGLDFDDDNGRQASSHDGDPTDGDDVFWPPESDEENGDRRPL